MAGLQTLHVSLIARRGRPAALTLTAVALASAFFGPAASPSTHARTGEPFLQRGPADGSIDLFNDIFAIVYQYGHTCRPDEI